jgi:hypothetical protein
LTKELSTMKLGPDVNNPWKNACSKPFKETWDRNERVD